MIFISVKVLKKQQQHTLQIYSNCCQGGGKKQLGYFAS